MKYADFLFANTNIQKLTVDWKTFGCTLSKMDVVILVMGLRNWLYLKNEMME